MFWGMNDEPISIEAEKLRFEFFKHLTTLSTGAVLATGAVTKGLIPHPNAPWLLIVAASFFLFSICGSLVGMLWKTQQISLGRTLEGQDRKDLRGGMYMALGCFMVGIVAILMFFWINLFFGS